MLRVVCGGFTRKSRKDYVPKIFKHSLYNPAQKGQHAKVQPPPEVLKLHKDFYDELEKHERIVAHNALFENIRERFTLLQGHLLQPEQFEEALAKLDHAKDVALICLNIQECIVRCAFVEDIAKLDYFLRKACYFGLKISSQAFEVAIKGLFRFSAHFEYHKRSPFQKSENEDQFCSVVRSIIELYKQNLRQEDSPTKILKELFTQVDAWIRAASDGSFAPKNSKLIASLVDEFNNLSKSAVTESGSQAVQGSKNKLSQPLGSPAPSLV